MTAFCTLMASSCTKPDEEVTLEVSAQYPTLSAKAGDMFLSIRSNSFWTVYLADELDGSVADWARVNASSGSGDRNLILSYDANTHETLSRTLRITVSCGKIAKIVTVEQAAAGVQPEPDPDPTPDPVTPPSTGLAKVSWMELPAMDNPDLTYRSHSFSFDGGVYRNYTYGYSKQDRVSLWVAYPLCRFYTDGSVGRSDWSLDPYYSIAEQQILYKAYKEYPTYDRGHQIPSADRQCCYQANLQTFYFTNSTPQLGPKFNQRIWMNLEQTVRNKWANVDAEGMTKDTLYVVTGCVVEGSAQYATDNNYDKVIVPTAYYKAVLKYSPNSTLGLWNACAIYLEHKNYSESNVTREHSMSIDELEKITGLDFFVNLPAKIGEDQAAKVEAADPADSSIWW